MDDARPPSFPKAGSITASSGAAFCTFRAQAVIETNRCQLLMWVNKTLQMPPQDRFPKWLGERLPFEVLKKAKYWREFTAPTRAEAEDAAAAWWAEQSGFDKISGWTLPANPPTPSADPQWTVTIIYNESDLERATATLH